GDAVGTAPQTGPEPVGFGGGRECVRPHVALERRARTALGAAIDPGGDDGLELGHGSILGIESRRIRTPVPSVRIRPIEWDYNGVMSRIESAAVSSPFMGLVVRIDDGVVVSASFSRVTRHQRDSYGVYDQLAAYFDGDVDALEQINVRADGTPFQLA